MKRMILAVVLALAALLAPTARAQKQVPQADTNIAVVWTSGVYQNEVAYSLVAEVVKQLRARKGVKVLEADVEAAAPDALVLRFMARPARSDAKFIQIGVIVTAHTKGSDYATYISTSMGEVVAEDDMEDLGRHIILNAISKYGEYLDSLKTVAVRPADACDTTPCHLYAK